MVKTTTGDREVRKKVEGVVYVAESDSRIYSNCPECGFYAGKDEYCAACMRGDEVIAADGNTYVLAEDIIWRESAEASIPDNGFPDPKYYGFCRRNMYISELNPEGLPINWREPGSDPQKAPSKEVE